MRRAFIAAPPSFRGWGLGAGGGDRQEFWESRRRTLAEEDAKTASRHTGTPSEMPSDLVAETTSTGTLKFKLNARTIHSIFTMYPIVFK